MNRWLQLTRLQTSGLTIGMLLITRWVCTGLEVLDTIVLILAGLLVHAGFFSLNEYADRDHDRGHPDKVNPITAGDISERTALSLSLGTLSLSLVLLAAWGWTWSWTSLPLISSYLLGTSYNLRAKKFPRLAPVILGGWAFMLSGWITGLSGFPLHAMWLPFAWGFMLLLQVLEGTLKDWEHDLRVRHGSLVESGVLYWDAERFIRRMDYIQYAFILAVAVAVFPWGILAILAVSIGGGGCWATLLAVQQTRHHREKMLQAMGLHNISEYGLVVAVCLIWVNSMALLLVFGIPLLMYGAINKLAYGQSTAPSI